MTDPLGTARAIGFGTVVAGVRLPFCAMNASGSATTVDEVRALRRSRTGAIVLKSATVHPFVHPSFRSLHNPGFDKLLPLVRDLAADRERPVVASLAATSLEEMGFLAKAFADAGATILEANLAEPYVETTLAPLESLETLRAVAGRLAGAGRPCWVKLPEHTPLPYGPVVATLLDAGVRAVVAHNDFHGYERLMLEAPAPIDVVVVGGIASGFDVATALRKGAKAVQVGSSLRAEGPGIFARLERELRRLSDGA